MCSVFWEHMEGVWNPELIESKFREAKVFQELNNQNI